MIELSPIVACICEGGAETAIIDMLVDNNLLRLPTPIRCVEP